MPLSDASQRDPSMLGNSGYDRNALDFYPTPKRTIESLLKIIEDDLPGYLVWEPFCGNGAFSTVMKAEARDCVSTDIVAYDGFDPDALFDFFSIQTVAERTALWERWNKTRSEEDAAKVDLRPSMEDIAALKGFMPDVIITNPPYTGKVEDGVHKTGKNKGKPKFKTIDLAGNAARHALKLMEPQKGIVIFLCRHEWDAAKSRRDLFDHPAFAMKITLRHRPRWIEGSTGAPRFPYSYYVWDWSKPAAAKPELLYAA